MRISIINEENECSHQWWMNFRRSLGPIELQADWINIGLSKFNGCNFPDEHHIEFETEEDATAFILRWS